MEQERGGIQSHGHGQGKCNLRRWEAGSLSGSGRKLPVTENQTMIERERQRERQKENEGILRERERESIHTNIARGVTMHQQKRITTLTSVPSINFTSLLNLSAPVFEKMIKTI